VSVLRSHKTSVRLFARTTADVKLLKALFARDHLDRIHSDCYTRPGLLGLIGCAGSVLKTGE
jgi:hypothetical protein